MDDNVILQGAQTFTWMPAATNTWETTATKYEVDQVNASKLYNMAEKATKKNDIPTYKWRFISVQSRTLLSITSSNLFKIYITVNQVRHFVVLSNVKTQVREEITQALGLRGSCDDVANYVLVVSQNLCNPSCATGSTVTKASKSFIHTCWHWEQLALWGSWRRVQIRRPWWGQQSRYQGFG